MERRREDRTHEGKTRSFGLCQSTSPNRFGFRESVAQVREVWRDQRAERFEREDLSDLDQIMEQLTIQLQKASEMIGRMDRQLRDESEE